MNAHELNLKFTKILLDNAQKEAKRKNIDVSNLSTWGCDGYFEVYQNEDLVWAGSAHNEYEAKAQAIFYIMG